ncbi:MAG: phytanoyl-CoA dioxygenase family protein [Capsulimonadales bacterium]|nr:phytanoyl-CoA dioxygenase family protein [Capsulimonadales bacterium]
MVKVLSDAELRFFETFGFLGFPSLLSDRIREIQTVFEEVWTSHGGGHHGKPHDGVARSCIVPFIDQDPRLASLIDDPRILAIAQGLCGDDFNYMGSDGNYYVGDTGWHSDGWHPEIRHIKIAFYLDPLTRETGALRVIPGSHRIGEPYAEQLQREIGKSRELWGLRGDDLPAVALETFPGDIVVFHHNLKHAAFGGGSRRRMFTINLCQRYPEEKIGELRDYLAGAARFWIERAYGEAMVETATPERMRHLEQVMANDGHLAELARAARERMKEPSRG